MPFTVSETKLQDVLLFDVKRFGDHRGWFMETFQQTAFAALGLDVTFVQDNCSRSQRRVLRGLHFQKPPHAQGKLIMPLTGQLYDVVVDLRKASPTYGQWQGVLLDGDSPQALWAPPGFAHGFQVLSDDALFWYKVTADYAPQHEGGLMWDDSTLAINWPLANPTLSDRDRQWPLWENFETPFVD